MSDQPLFQNMDEEERIYAPEQLPADEQARVRADEGRVRVDPDEPPAAAPVANLGNAPSAAMAPPNSEFEQLSATPSDPDTDPASQLDQDRQ